MINYFMIFICATTFGIGVIATWIIAMARRNKNFRKKCLNAEIRPDRPITGYFFLGEEKIHSVFRDRKGLHLSVEYQDEHGKHSRKVHINDYYPAW